MATAFSSELTCPICLELFSDPVTLPCMHSYCRKCLESILHSDGGKQVQCPECRSIAFLDQRELEKLPVNFFIANIVEKYRNVDSIPKIPCDICGEITPQGAVKSCKECKISYCGGCLYLHPKKGVLATHSLVEPKDFNQQRLEQFCLKCLVVPEEGADLSKCKKDHPTEVEDSQIAKMKLMNEIEESFAVLTDRKRKHINDIHKTEEALDNLQTIAEETRVVVKTEIKRKLGSVLSEFEANVHQTREKGQQHLLQLRRFCTNISELLTRMSLFIGSDMKEVDIKELLAIQNRMSEEVRKETILECDLSPPHLDFAKKLAQLDVPHTDTTSSHNASNCPKMSHEERPQIIEKLRIYSCTPIVRKREEGAAVTMNWSSVEDTPGFEVTFTEVTAESTQTIFTVKGISIPFYTETHLRHDTTYDVTVSIQDNPLSESKSKRFSTPPGISCEAFQFSSAVKSSATELRWDNKHIVYCESAQSYRKQKPSTNRLRKIRGGVMGTLALQDTFQYWEVKVSFHFRGVRDGEYVAAVGICAAEKIDAIPSLARNYFFYGLDYAKSDYGCPMISFKSAGIETAWGNLEPERNYNKRIGFFFNPRQLQITIIGIESNCTYILYTSDKLKVKPGTVCKYYPICDLNDEGDGSIELITGCDIKEVPSMIEEVLLDNVGDSPVTESSLFS